MTNAAVTVSFIADPWHPCLHDICSPLRLHLGICVTFTILFVTSNLILILATFSKANIPMVTFRFIDNHMSLDATKLLTTT
ncbi:hypothetical protein L596_026405 [Steinernema carpocapsae]|uniref:Uncharacterized protein n=1 Tax=Steinernema carpocapsae TaxID=34508 RepID=A0A4U5M187_STECR|nr:hypothetical protein L596_026405 [Steinernema carpocapsae]